MKTCPRCKVPKPLDEFGTNRRTRDGRSLYCKECRRVEASKRYHADKSYMQNYNKQYRKKNKEVLAERNFMRAYGVSSAVFHSMKAKQHNRCAICNASFDEVKACFDHCHTTGQPRGILCSNCNTAIGLMADSPTTLRQAAEYLESCQTSS